MSTLVLEAIDEQIGDFRPDEVDVIEIYDIQMEKIPEEVKKRLECYQNLGCLAFDGCGLKSLENFPNLPNLTSLDLSDNKLTGGSLKPLAGYKGL